VLSLNASAFLAIPDPQNKRVLHEGKVIKIDDTRVVLQLEQALTAELGDVTLFANKRGKFFQQAATLVSIGSAIPMTVELQTIGEPVSAEQRGSYRTCVISWCIPVHVNKLTNCQLADVSAEGIGVICPKPLTVGTMVDVALDVDGMKILGQLKVQTAKIMPSGKLRFGLFVPDRRSETRQQLQKLAAYMQRAQLKRMSGAA
jgi:hypothetical protein